MWQPVSSFTSIHVSAALALIPLIWIFAAMLKLKMPVHKAGLTALALSAALALTVWRMPALYALQAVFEGILLGLWPIILVIFAALFTYNMMVRSGSMAVIHSMLSGLSADRRIQALVIAFAFGGFLESVAGFGTAVAIPAGILAAMGFEPLFAAVLCLAANTVPVALGVVGIPIITLAEVTGLPLGELALNAALQLFPMAVLLPVFLIFLTTRSLKGIKGVWLIALASGFAFGAGQLLTAWIVGPELSAVVGSLASLAVLLLWNRRFPVKKPWTFDADRGTKAVPPAVVSFREGLKAWSPYMLILVLVLGTSLLPFLRFLGQAPFAAGFLFYKGPGGKPLTFSLVKNPGTLILIAALIGGLIQRLSIGELLRTARDTLKQISKTIVTVLSIVSIAKLMGYSGMISSVAVSLASLSGSFFPLISPLLGALGTFITGSDTSSNVLFGELQKQTAMQIGAPVSWITAANASGATIGKMISPQSIAIATSATGLAGSEGLILSRTLKYAAVFTALLGALVYLGYLIIR